MVTCSRTGTRSGTDETPMGLSYENTGISESIYLLSFLSGNMIPLGPHRIPCYSLLWTLDVGSERAEAGHD